MKPISLQFITVKLENGQDGIFVGAPILHTPGEVQENQVSEIWFSDIKDMPETMPLAKLIELVKSQLSRCDDTLH